MTAKRFKLLEYLPNVVQIKDNNQKLNSYEIVDLLNELHEENQAIQEKVFKLMDWLEKEKGVNREEIKEWWND